MKTLAGYVVLIVLCGALGAQEPDAPSEGRVLTGTPPAMSADTVLPLDLAGITGDDKTPPPVRKQKQKPARKPAPAKELKRTRIGASMVGYLESSLVQTQVRVRMDAGFDSPRPDRAEYFYAGTSTPPTGPVQRTLNFQEVYILGEYAPVKRLSGFVQVPFRWIQPVFVSGATPSATPPSPPAGAGISDVQAGMRFAIIASASRNLTVQLGTSFPSGNGNNGLGTGHSSIEPKALGFQRISDRAAIEAEVGDSHPNGGTTFVGATPASPAQSFSADVAMYGVGPSYELIRRDKYSIAPVFELVSWHVFGGLQTGSNNVVQSAAGINILNAKLGARANFSNGSSIYAGYGRGLTSDIWYRNLFRVEYRRAF
jgi:hypothetical protein